MIVSINGHKTFLSTEEVARIREQAVADLKRRLADVQAWVDSVESNKVSGNPISVSIQSFNKSFNYLIEQADFYCRLNGTAPKGELRDAFKRDEFGDIAR